MLEKNRKKAERKNRPLWNPYYQRVVSSKKAYKRKPKHSTYKDYD